MLIEFPEGWRDYELVDSGDFEKLERFGMFYLIRPESKALWGRSMSTTEWNALAHTKFTQGAGFGKSGKEDSGIWHQLKKMPERWNVIYDGGAFSKGGKVAPFTLRMGLTSFKHVGVFPEQAPNWDFISGEVLRLKAAGVQEPKVLNLFAYTGAASLAARSAGAQVTHLDSVRQVVTWAKDNMELSSLSDIRWVIEDALKFVKREAKRGNRYNGLILDPPAYGHGPEGEKWKLDELLFELMTGCREILLPQKSFMVLNLYSNGYSAVLADTVVRSAFGLLGKKADIKYGELALKDKFGKALPLSVFVRLSR